MNCGNRARRGGSRQTVSTGPPVPPGLPRPRRRGVALTAVCARTGPPAAAGRRRARAQSGAAGEGAAEAWDAPATRQPTVGPLAQSTARLLQRGRRSTPTRATRGGDLRVHVRAGQSLTVRRRENRPRRQAPLMGQRCAVGDRVTLVSGTIRQCRGTLPAPAPPRPSAAPPTPDPPARRCRRTFRDRPKRARV